MEGGGLLETGFDNAYRGPSIGKEGENDEHRDTY